MSTDCIEDIIRLDCWSYHAEAGVSPHKSRDTHVHGLGVEGRKRRSWDVTTYMTDADTQTAHARLH